MHGANLAADWPGWMMARNSEREPKSSVDLLEHVTDGGVHVDSRLLERSSSRESMIGGVVTAESGSQSRYLEPGRDDREASRRKR